MWVVEKYSIENGRITVVEPLHELGVMSYAEAMEIANKLSQQEIMRERQVSKHEIRNDQRMGIILPKTELATEFPDEVLDSYWIHDLLGRTRYRAVSIIV
jgi:hypothetical protein